MKKKENLDFNHIDLHDALFNSFSIDNINNYDTKITIHSSIYLSEADNERTNIKIIFKKVKRNTIICDYKELDCNKNAGQFDSSYLYNNTYRFSLFGGFIEIVSKSEPMCYVEREELSLKDEERNRIQTLT